MASSPLMSAPPGFDAAPPSLAPALPPLTLAGLQGNVTPAQAPQTAPIERLRPDSDLHRDTLQKLSSMFKYSQNEMNKNHSRWQFMEHQIQAYVQMPDYSRLMKHVSTKDNLPPEPVKVIVPYNYATIHAAATYLATSLFGRRPMFPLIATRGTAMDKSRYMELAIQDGIRQSKGYEALFQWVWDSLVYGFGSGSCLWEERTGPIITLVGGQRMQNTGLQFSGNILNNIDPYRFYPDPRVPMSKVNTQGDFVFWTSNQSELFLRDLERSGTFRYIDAGAARKNNTPQSNGELPPVQDLSQRRALIGLSGEWTPSPQDVTSFHSVREGTVRLVPKDWKLGDSDQSEIWKFTVLNAAQIIQAQPLGYVHGRHPIFVTEPTSLGYDFGSLSMADMIAPFQDLISWHVNSRLENVRATINNQFVYDPARIEGQDLRQGAAGKAIRLKKSAAGTPLDQAIQQLVVTDVTAGHINDIQVLRTLADATTGINDNMRGIQTAGGRRSATEARMSMQAGASRLSQLAVRISSQGLQDLAEQMIFNIQQFMPNEMWVEVTGDEGVQGAQLLRPDMIIGSFNYQISDGSLPFDKMALLEVYQQGMIAVLQDPELRQNYDVVRLFDYIGELAGAKNLSSFKRQPPEMGDPAALQQQAQAGNLVPLGPGMPSPGAMMG